ncbi:hypothetical protein [Desulfococcus sp.]|uniref:hypothetical protein n=1 Tax=Desulfococcus sp. TaxID=2025834 RepID=UPI0035947F45
MASSVDEQILRAAKEIVVKFIETGRVSPTSFSEAFKSVYKTVFEAVHGPGDPPGDAPEKTE